MSEERCKGFYVAIKNDRDRSASLSVHHSFTTEGAGEDDALLTVDSEGLEAQIHTDRQSLIRFAERVLREFGEGE